MSIGKMVYTLLLFVPKADKIYYGALESAEPTGQHITEV
ncbi:hypothetical protein SAMN05446037_1004215 [Anaerovirgula multivorans]|uniref:Uncharacterized protein n=1 Tax=Anaerovirgula multivorans TaxID=312168 RepID=A0A239BZE2_9FIRM|nr:hypothetical protein SAMN05446037_1004215 [Anaerovirgula multivorans]